jgi:hypothetical protein
MIHGTCLLLLFDDEQSVHNRTPSFIEFSSPAAFG